MYKAKSKKKYKSFPENVGKLSGKFLGNCGPFPRPLHKGCLFVRIFLGFHRVLNRPQESKLLNLM